MKILRNILLTAIGLILFFYSIGQQVPDTSFSFPIRQSAYKQGAGPVIYIDQAHNNFHTKDGGFFAFSKLLGQDGYRIQSLSQPIENAEALKGCKILVIANALNSLNVDNWVLPTPSAFSDEEIENIRQWVKNGGSLLLIADHMPFAGASYKLGKAFGFEFINGFAITGERSWPPTVFYLKDKTLRESPIVSGVKDYEKIEKIATFTGSAFKAPEESIPVLSFLSEHHSLQPDTAWSFNTNTPSQSLDGFCQGALLKYGKGRVAVFGEAAMFTAQIANGNMRVGLNSDEAPHNAQFTLNLVHWLDGVQKYTGPINKVHGNNAYL